MPQTPFCLKQRGLVLHNRLVGQRLSLRSGAASATQPALAHRWADKEERSCLEGCSCGGIVRFEDVFSSMITGARTNVLLKQDRFDNIALFGCVLLRKGCEGNLLSGLRCCMIVASTGSAW